MKSQSSWQLEVGAAPDSYRPEKPVNDVLRAVLAIIAMVAFILGTLALVYVWERYGVWWTAFTLVVYGVTVRLVSNAFRKLGGSESE
jgi:hypothetical protein